MGISARTSYLLEISNHGAIIDRYVLTDFNEDRVIFDKDKLHSSLLKLSSDNPKAALKNDASYEIKSLDATHIVLRHVTKEGLLVERSYHFKDQQSLKKIFCLKIFRTYP